MANDFKRGIRIYLETSDYGKGIDAMVTATAKYEKKLEELKAEADKMTAAGQNTGKAWKDLQKQIQQNEKALKQSLAAEADYRAKLQQTEKVLKNLSGVSYNELLKVKTRLNAELRNATRGTKEYNTILEQHKRVSKEMIKAQKEMEVQVGCNANIFGKVTTFANKYWTVLAAGIASITGVSTTFRKLAEDVAKMDDVYSDVMKTTNLTKEEVLRLNDSFKKMDTRTSRESLNMLARDAGKLGIEGTKNILDFVDAGNQINVALGEDLGEDAIKNIGKMVGVFDKSTKYLQGMDLKGQMLAVGSAINELGASSSANEDYLVQFAGRLGGVASQAGISIDAILGFGSALDQDMQQVEMSATALQNFIMKIMGEPAKFAKIAGLEVKQFTNLLNTDANSAIKQVLRALNDKGGFQQLIPIFNEMGLDGARAVGVLSSMASSIGKIDEAQHVANKALTEGTSITKEYNIKNENLAAKLEKARKEFKEISLQLGESLNPILLKSTNATSYLIRALVELPKWLRENKGLLITLTLVMAAYTIAVNRARISSALWYAGEKIKIYWTKVSTAATLLQVAATGYLTGATRAANLATKQFFATLGLNPFIAIGVAIAAVTIGLYKWITANKEVNQSTKSLLDIQKNATEEYQKQASEVDVLVAKIKNENLSNAERKKAIEALKAIIPGYNGMLTEEGLLINHNTSEIDKYLISLEKQIKMKAAQDEWEELIRKKRIADQELEKQRLRNEKVQEDNKPGLVTGGEVGIAGSIAKSQIRIKSQNEYNAALKTQTDIQNAILLLEKEIKGSTTTVKDDGPKVGDQQIINGVLMQWDGKKWVKVKITGGGTPDDKAYENALKEKEKAYKESQLELMELRRTGELTEETYNQIALQTQLTFLEEKKKLQQKFKKDTIDTEMEISNQKMKIGQDADKFALEAIKTQQEAGLQALQSGENNKQEMLQDALTRGIITERNYNIEMKKLAVELNAAKLALAEASLKALEKVNFNDKELQKKALADALAEIAKLKEQLLKAQGDLAKDTAKEVEDNTRTVAERMEGIFGSSFSNIGKMFTTFTENLNKLKDGELKSWEDWGVAIGETVMSALAVATEINDQYFEYKAASLEADKQRELTNAGDTAEAREAIMQDYAQKELDLKKKQSSADTVLKVAQAVAAGGLAIIQAFAQLGPIGGAIAAVLIGGITGLQIGSIIKQNAAIQATTLDSTTISGGEPPKVGARVATTPQAADGRWDVVGADDGLVYRNVPYAGVARTGMVTIPTLVGEAGSELIVDNPTLRNIAMNAPWVLDTIRQLRVPQRASGNYEQIGSVTGGSGSSHASITVANMEVIQANTDAINHMIALLMYLRENGIDAFVLLNELERKQILKNKSEKKGSIS